ncbi:hypothetical protein STXM2123_998 [Streptomyces sp. F-3]|nr:hypothetical protein STXM2123_998 [Streptomyces sp. F-3]
MCAGRSSAVRPGAGPGPRRPLRCGRRPVVLTRRRPVRGARSGEGPFRVPVPVFRCPAWPPRPADASGKRDSGAPVGCSPTAQGGISVSGPHPESSSTPLLLLALALSLALVCGRSVWTARTEQPRPAVRLSGRPRPCAGRGPPPAPWRSART